MHTLQCLKADISQYPNRKAQGKKSVLLNVIIPIRFLLVTMDIVCGHHAKSTLTNSAEAEMDMKNEIPIFTLQILL